MVPGAVLGMKGPDGKVILSAYGFTDLEKGIPMETNHRFRGGSITKTFTAAGILRLLEKGTLSLEQTVDSVLPVKVPGGKPLTLRMHADIYTGAMFIYKEEDIVLLANGRKKGAHGDATDLFYEFVKEVLPEANAGKFDARLNLVENYGWLNTSPTEPGDWR